MPATPIADVDGDGRLEIVVSLHRDRWELKVYDALTGRERLSVPDLYVHSLTDLDGDGIPEIVSAEEPARTPREFTTLILGSLRSGAWRERWRGDRCRLEYTSVPLWPSDLSGRNLDPRIPVILEEGAGKTLFLAEDAEGDGRADRMVRLVPGSGEGFDASGFPLEGARDLRALAVAGRHIVATTDDAKMRLLTSAGEEVASWDCVRPGIAGAAVADLNGDGRNEMILCRADRRVVAIGGAFGRSGLTREFWSVHGSGIPAPSAYGPAAFVTDLDGDGKKETLTACPGDSGGAGVQLLDSRGRIRWKTTLPATVDSPLYGAIARATFGDFDGDGHLDVYVSARMAATGNDACHSFALDGRSGKVLWHNDASDPALRLHTLGPTGLPAVADVDGDGHPDLLLVTLDLCVALHGRSGRFIQTPLIANGIWKQADRSTQWTAYGTQIPADLDGDGKEEFLAGGATLAAIRALGPDRGGLLWEVPVPGGARSPGVADLDGDGLGEIVVGCGDGKIRVYK